MTSVKTQLRTPQSYANHQSAADQRQTPPIFGTPQSLASDESQQIGIDGVGLGGRHAVRKPL
jgi:hypothetical protein